MLPSSFSIKEKLLEERIFKIFSQKSSSQRWNDCERNFCIFFFFENSPLFFKIFSSILKKKTWKMLRLILKKNKFIFSSPFFQKSLKHSVSGKFLNFFQSFLLLGKLRSWREKFKSFHFVLFYSLFYSNSETQCYY